ncbi:MAG TPA: hypothetical protein V6C82_09030, partial [Chroococcales cyanobacterium]
MDVKKATGQVLSRPGVQATVSQTVKQGTQPLSPYETSVLDPGILEAKKRFFTYQAALTGREAKKSERSLLNLRKQLDELRLTFPRLSETEWFAYLATDPQKKIEHFAEAAAAKVVKEASGESRILKGFSKTEVALFENLAKKLSPPFGADLEKLYKDGALLKQDAAKSGNLLHYLNELASVDLGDLVKTDEADKRTVLEQVIHDIARPEEIQQRLSVTCLGAAE